MERTDIFKEYIECETDEEMDEAVRQLMKKGYDMFDIYEATWQGKDKFHREVFVFDR